MYPNSRLLCTEMQENETASSEKAVEGVVTCGQNPSLALAPPRVAVGVLYLSLYTHHPRYFVILHFFSLKGLPKLYTFQDSKSLDPPLLREMGGVELQIVSVSLRESREHSEKRLMKQGNLPMMHGETQRVYQKERESTSQGPYYREKRKTNLQDFSIFFMQVPL